MRILLLHVDDSEAGPWRQEKWDLVVDLGRAGPETYGRWGGVFGCRVEGLPALDLADFQYVRETLFATLGRMMDFQGNDWWELISIEYHERVERILRLEKLARRTGTSDEVVVSRSGFDGRVMELLLGRAVRVLGSSHAKFERVRRIARAAARLRFGQVVQILGDKYDAGYAIRRLTSRRDGKCGRPVVLLPSAYVNVSQTGLAYAAGLPDRDFLLVTTRESGWVGTAPKNVTVARLAAYAPGGHVRSEHEEVLECWVKMQAELRERPELFILSELGDFDCVPAMLRDGLTVRDAWLGVFQRESVTAVLCSDDSNTYTRLPLLMARERGMPAIGCHHGALDGRHLIKRNHADMILTKGRMEHDYLTRVCGVPKTQVEIGAPMRSQSRDHGGSEKKDRIVFFSEPYEIAGGRVLEFYREVLPALAEIAAAKDSELVVKLHPQESLRERTRLVRAALSRQQWQCTQVVSGRLSEELMSRTWFAATVQSTMAMECTLRGIPAFVCTWLEYTDWRYAEQYVKFGAGMGIESAQEIRRIPAMLERFEKKRAVELWEAIRPERLDELLSQPMAARIAAAV